MVARNIYNIIRVLGPFSREIERESDRREGGGKTELGMGGGAEGKHQVQERIRARHRWHSGPTKNPAQISNLFLFFNIK